MNWKQLTIAPSATHHVHKSTETPAYSQRFDEVLAFHAPGLAPVQLGKDAYHIKETGDEAYPYRFNRCFGFYDEIAAVITEQGWRHILPNGIFAHEKIFSWSGNFQEGICTVQQKNGSYVHIDTKGHPLYENEWNYAGDFRYGISVVQSKIGKSTHINKRGEFLHQEWFLDLDVFHKGYARAQDEQGWMHINKHGKALYSERYAMVEPFYNGRARVEAFDGNLLIIDETGYVRTQLRAKQTDDFAELSADLVGFWKTQTIAAAVKIGVFEHLPNTVEEIALQTNSNPFRLERLLKGLGELHLVQRTGKIWQFTNKGQFLQQNHVKSLAGAALEYAGPFYERWMNLPDAFKISGGWSASDVFEDIAVDDSRVVRHTQMIESYAKHDYEKVVQELNLKGAERIIDVGGGSGALAKYIQKYHPQTKIVILERPEVVEKMIPEGNISWKIQDIFTDWNELADVILFSRILHDWNDSLVQQLLSQAGKCLVRSGRLLILEMVLAEDDFGGSLCDMHLMVSSDGQERTLDEYTRLLNRSGFRLLDIRKTDALPSIVEGSRIEIPQSVLTNLKKVPKNKSVILLLRHSAREKLAQDFSVSYVQSITERGKEIAFELGNILGDRLGDVHSSPLTRCVETVQYIQMGANNKRTIHKNRILGDPGVFVLDGKLGGKTWFEYSNEEINESLCGLHARPLPGLAWGYEAAMFALQSILFEVSSESGIHLFTTHDSILAGICSHFFGKKLSLQDWPEFLEGAFIWVEEDRVHLQFRNEETQRRLPLCLITEKFVLEHAKREIFQTIGSDVKARFFVAGGMFNTLLKAKPINDIDIWAASKEDHEIIVQALLEKGAFEHEKMPYRRVFSLNDRTIELTDNYLEPSLEALIDKFDISISGIGVEFCRDGSQKVLIRDEIFDSLKKKEIQLLRPVRKTTYLLTTLERMKRYGEELGFSVSSSDVDEILERIFSVKFGSKDWLDMKDVYQSTTRYNIFSLNNIQSQEDWIVWKNKFLTNINDGFYGGLSHKEG